MIKKILPVVIILFQIQIMGQTSSSYSRSGLGDIEYTYSARRLGMGQLGTAVADVDFINTINPAGWNRINRTRFEIGVAYSGMYVSSDGIKNFYAETEFAGFTIAFPISFEYGTTLTAGIIPYSNVSYNVVENYTSEIAGDYKIAYTGSGGLSKLFFGSSFKLMNNISIGATLDYYFGNLNYRSKTEFPRDSDYRSAEYLRTYSPRGIGTTVGIISPDLSRMFGFRNLTNMRLGASANIFSSLSTDTVLTALRELAIDTVAGAVVDMNVPPRIITGLSFTIDDDYLVLLDYAFQQWENYKLDGVTDANLRNSYKLSGGFEYRPSKEIGSSFLEQIIFRGGLSYEQTQYTFNGTDINQYSITTGFSLPLSAGNTLDFGILYGIRGTESLVKENIIKINAGISLGDIWFIRQEK